MKSNKGNVRFNIFDFLFFIEKKVVLPVFGVFFIIVGIIGLFIPIIQGIAFILLGVALLGNKRLKNFIYKKILGIKWLKKKHAEIKTNKDTIIEK